MFVCHGNICRSVMAEFIMKDLISTNHLEDEFEIDSAAVSREETGNPIYPSARKILEEHHVPILNHRARTITRSDYDHYDEIYVMDNENMRRIHQVLPYDPDHKIAMLIPGQPIADPWWTDDFETAYEQIVRGCKRLIEPDFTARSKH